MRIVLRVVRGGHFDPSQLLGCGTPIVHVARGHQGIVVDSDHAIGQLEGLIGHVLAPVAWLGARA